jgi:nicotinamidase/pyrazinamidase
MDALIAVDVQRDFLPGGALAVPEGDAVIPALERLATEAPLVVATRDWHAPDDPSFEAQGGPWPIHCVRDTEGAQLDARIEKLASLIVDKPTNDATFSTPLVEELRSRSVHEVTLGGLALEYCVMETALGLRKEGFAVTVALGATRHITEESAAAARAKLEDSAVRLG